MFKIKILCFNLLFYESLLSAMIIPVFDVPMIRNNMFYFLELPVLSSGG